MFGAVAGLGVATLGLWAESWWIDAVYHYPWPTSMWGEGLAMAVPVAIATGICGALFGMVLTGRALPSARVSGVLVALTVLIVGGAVANGLRTEVPDARATITLEPVPGSGGTEVSAEVRLDPADVVGDNPEWVSIMSWQGGLDDHRGLNIDTLERIAPGQYRSTTHIPVSGSWKTLLRIQDGTTMAGVPIYLPADPGIGAEGYAAQPESTTPFVEEIKILQRERNFDHPSWLYTVASLVVLVCSLVIIAALSWGAWRINSSGSLTGSRPRPAVPSS